LPLFLQFGSSFFMYYDQFPYPPLSKVLYKMSIGVFGLIGILAIGISICSIILKGREQRFAALFETTPNKKIVIASITVIVLFIISYFRLPQKSGYMITIIPFLILLFGYYLSSKMFKFLCVSFIFSSFICSINLTDKLRGATYSKYAITFTVSGQELFFDLFSGPIFSDYSKRNQKIKYASEVIEKASSIHLKTVIIAGWWYNEIMVTMIPLPKNNFVVYEAYIDENKINSYLNEGYKIYYLPEQNIYNDQLYKMNITDRISEKFNF
jgi:hypothetical protein